MLLFASCAKERVVGEGPVVTETRNQSGFSGIDLRVPGHVYYTPSPNYKVEVKAQQNIVDVLETYISNNKLVIRFENDVQVRRHHDITITISAPNLNSLRVSGSGDINTSGVIDATNMDMDISGSGNITVSHMTADYVMPISVVQAILKYSMVPLWKKN